MLVSNRGPLVTAVNASPELERIERATGIDVAGKIYEHLERQLAGPEKKPAQPARVTVGPPVLAIAPETVGAAAVIPAAAGLNGAVLPAASVLSGVAIPAATALNGPSRPAATIIPAASSATRAVDRPRAVVATA